MVATNLAEALIERRRGFARLTDATNTWPAYDDIATETYTSTRAGIVYTVNSVVTPYYYNRATDSFVYTNPGASLYSDFKQMVVTVSWTTPDFRTTEGNTIAQATMGTGSITLVETVSSVTTAASSRVVTQDDEDIDDYSITYTPGLRPDIVSLSLGNNKFKESLTPQPDVIKAMNW